MFYGQFEAAIDAGQLAPTVYFMRSRRNPSLLEEMALLDAVRTVDLTAKHSKSHGRGPLRQPELIRRIGIHP